LGFENLDPTPPYRRNSLYAIGKRIEQLKRKRTVNWGEWVRNIWSKVVPYGLGSRLMYNISIYYKNIAATVFLIYAIVLPLQAASVQVLLKNLLIASLQAVLWPLLFQVPIVVMGMVVGTILTWKYGMFHIRLLHYARNVLLVFAGLYALAYIH